VAHHGVAVHAAHRIVWPLPTSMSAVIAPWHNKQLSCRMLLFFALMAIGS
jgi:hypothetical protein